MRPFPFFRDTYWAWYCTTMLVCCGGLLWPPLQLAARCTLTVIGTPAAKLRNCAPESTTPALTVRSYVVVPLVRRSTALSKQATGATELVACMRVTWMALSGVKVFILPVELNRKTNVLHVCEPEGPMGPVAPVAPVGPCGPAGPCGPIGPLSPVGLPTQLPLASM